jgi:hypothetical protein
MSTLKKSISIVLAILMLISVFTVVPLTAGAAETHKRHTKANTEKNHTGDAIQSGNYYYYLNDDGEAQISSYSGSVADLVIPDTLDGRKVVGIDSEVFEDHEEIKNIQIPDSVTHIGSDAFYNTGFYNNKANWENGVLYSGKFLIKADNMTGTYTIKDGTTVIASEAFYEWHLIENEDYNYEDDDYYEDGTYSELEGVVIPSSVTHIGYCAFVYCDKLKSVTLSNGLKYIEDSAFYNCAALKSISIPNSVTTIEDSAFDSCTSLENVTLPSGLTSINWGLFKYCRSLNSIIIPNSVKEIGEGAFYDTGIYNNESNWTNGVLYYGKYLLDTKSDFITGSYTIKSGTEIIADYAFGDCSNLTSITIPDSISSISYDAFYQCTSLSNVNMGKNIKKIDGWAFEYCTNLKNISIPDSVTIIEYCAFYCCQNLANVKIGKNVKEIGESAFYRTALKSVTIPANVTTIGERAFGYYAVETMDAEGDTTYTTTKVSDFTINGYAGTAAEKYASANGFKFVKLTPPKKVKQANTLKVSAKTKAVKAKKLKKKKQTVKPLTIKNAKGAVTVTKVKKGSTAKLFKKITVNKKTGAITIKKGKYAKKTYKIKLKITAKGNSSYNSKTLTKVVKIKVK